MTPAHATPSPIKQKKSHQLPNSSKSRSSKLPHIMHKKPQPKRNFLFSLSLFNSALSLQEDSNFVRQWVRNFPDLKPTRFSSPFGRMGGGDWMRDGTRSFSGMLSDNIFTSFEEHKLVSQGLRMAPPIENTL